MSTSTEKKVLTRSSSSYSFRTPPEYRYTNYLPELSTRNDTGGGGSGGGGSTGNIYDLVRSSFNVFRPSSSSSLSNQLTTSNTCSSLSDDFASLYSSSANPAKHRSASARKFPKIDRSRRRTLQEFQSSVRLSEEPDDLFHSPYTSPYHPTFTTFAQSSREREREREKEREKERDRERQRERERDRERQRERERDREEERERDRQRELIMGCGFSSQRRRPSADSYSMTSNPLLSKTKSTETFQQGKL